METHKKTQNNTNGNWNSIVDAVNYYKVSRRTLYQWIKDEKITTKKVGKNRFIWIDKNEDAHPKRATSQTKFTNETISHLQSEIEFLREQVVNLQTELANQKQRSDIVVIELSQHNNKLLEQSKRPFWKFW